MSRENQVMMMSEGEEEEDVMMSHDNESLTVSWHLHAVQTATLHQRARQRLVTGAFRQTAPTGLTNQSGEGAGPLIRIHHRFY